MDLEQEELLPAATEATPDIICWLRAAVPARPDGGLKVRRTAEVLGVSESTIRRWVKEAGERDFNPEALKILRKFAILRGHGDFLWPPLDPISLQRQQLLRERALIAYDHADDSDRIPTTVVLFHQGAPNPAKKEPDGARVIGVAIGRARYGAKVIDQLTVPSKFDAQLLKAAVMEVFADHACIVPRVFMATSRTEVWHQRAGDVALAGLDYVASARAARRA